MGFHDQNFMASPFKRFYRSRVNSAQNQLGPNQVGPKPTRPKTKSAQNQLGPKPTRPCPGLRDPSLFFSFLFSSSFIVCIMPWEFISLIVSWSKNCGNLEYCRPNFQTVTVMWIKVYCLEWEWVRESIFWYQGVQCWFFFFQKMAKKNHFFCSKDFGKAKKLKI